MLGWLPLRRLTRDEAGATAIEYGLIAALIAVAIIASLMLMNGSMDSLYAKGLEGPAAIMSQAGGG